MFKLLLVGVLLVVSTFVTPSEANTALIIVDVQNCFLPGGSLAVTDGDAVIPVIREIRETYKKEISLTVFTKDWHCPDHVSFASQHPGYNPFESINLLYNKQGELCKDSASCDVAYNLSQTLWPDHCVISSDGANISTQLMVEPGDVVVKKGYHCHVDSYSGFYDNGGFSGTELDTVLKKHSIDTVLVTGLALDYCVYYTAKDASKLGYRTYIVEDASRPVSQANVETVLSESEKNGVHVVESKDLDAVVSSFPILDALCRKYNFWFC